MDLWHPGGTAGRLRQPLLNLDATRNQEDSGASHLLSLGMVTALRMAVLEVDALVGMTESLVRTPAVAGVSLPIWAADGLPGTHSQGVRSTPQAPRSPESRSGLHDPSFGTLCLLSNRLGLEFLADLRPGTVRRGWIRSRPRAAKLFEGAELTTGCPYRRRGTSTVVISASSRPRLFPQALGDSPPYLSLVAIIVVVRRQQDPR